MRLDCRSEYLSASYRQDRLVPIEHLPPDTPIDCVAEKVREHGCVIVDDLCPQTTLDLLRNECEPYYDRTPKGDDNFMGGNTQRIRAIVNKSDAAVDMISNPLTTGVVTDLITQHNTAVQLHFASLINIGPGESAQPVHRDQWAWDMFPFPKGRHVMANCIWAAKDFTEANGATRIAPGSHLADDRLKIPVEQTEAAEMSAGSVLIFLGSVYHGGGANRTESDRPGLAVGYAANWLRQEENQYLAVSRERAKNLTPEMQKLIGYDQLYSLGFVDNYKNPLEILTDND